MPDDSSHDYSDEQYDAIQAVLDRVGSYQEGATDRTVESALQEGFTESDVEVADADVSALAAAIEQDQGIVQAREVLATGGG